MKYSTKENVTIVREEIDKEKDGKFLSITIETPHLILKHATFDNEKDYIKFFSDETVMEKYLGGPKNQDWVKKRLGVYHDRLKLGNPLSGFAVYIKENNEFVGHCVVGVPDKDGKAEMAGAGFSDFWKNGYGTESADALLHHFIPYLKNNSADFHPDIEKIKSISSTARLDNRATNIICKRMGFGDPEYQKGEGDEKRNVYSISVERLLENEMSKKRTRSDSEIGSYVKAVRQNEEKERSTGR